MDSRKKFLGFCSLRQYITFSGEEKAAQGRHEYNTTNSLLLIVKFLINSVGLSITNLRSNAWIIVGFSY